MWLAVRAAPNGRTSVAAIADDRVGAAGQPLFYSPSDTMPGPDRGDYLELGPEAFRPDAPPYRIETADRKGVDGRRLASAADARLGAPGGRAAAAAAASGQGGLASVAGRAAGDAWPRSPGGASPRPAS